jgi:hypothetical protein
MQHRLGAYEQKSSGEHDDGSAVACGDGVAFGSCADGIVPN